MAYFARYMLDEHGNMQKVVINAGVGFVLPYYGETAPPGTLACDGSAVSRTVYDELFQVLGTKAGAGDGSTTFNLPDFRGAFLRCIGGNAAALGVEQEDAIREIEGTLYALSSYTFSSTVNDGAFDKVNAPLTAGLAGDTGLTVGGAHNYFKASNVVPTAAENRPVNVALLWCIIYE